MSAQFLRNCVLFKKTFQVWCKSICYFHCLCSRKIPIFIFLQMLNACSISEFVVCLKRPSSLCTISIIYFSQMLNASSVAPKLHAVYKRLIAILQKCQFFCIFSLVKKDKLQISKCSLISLLPSKNCDLYEKGITFVICLPTPSAIVEKQKRLPQIFTIAQVYSLRKKNHYNLFIPEQVCNLTLTKNFNK